MANPALASAAPSAPPRPRKRRRPSARPKGRPTARAKAKPSRRAKAQPRARTKARPSARTKARPSARPSSRPRPKRRPASAARMVQPAFAGAAAGAAMLPHAAVRTAGAVRDLSDSGLIVRLTRGRGWIALLSALLFGIVALNVVSLSLNAGSGRVSQAVEELERQNSSLRAQLAEQLSASRIEGSAAVEGLAVPAPEDISYLSAEDGDIDRLVGLLENDTLLSGEPWTPSYASSTVSYVPASPSSGSGASDTTSSASPPPAAPSPVPAPASSAPAPSSGGVTTTGAGGVGL
jgi:hypothetical protein